MSDHLPDRRINAYRNDLAAEYLRGKVDVANFTEGKVHHVVTGSVALRREPRHVAPLDTEFLFGETLTVFEEKEGWAWAQAKGDSYVGYLSADALDAGSNSATHRIAAVRSHIYPAPDIKARVVDVLSMNAQLDVESIDGKFARLRDGRFVPSAHIAPLDAFEADFVAVAERFLGTPYLWGGRTSIGLDCSALVQMALCATGVECPRDSDMQEGTLGDAVPDPQDSSSCQRGDLVFWKGHVGIVHDETTLLHANAHHMACAFEPLDDAFARIAAAEGPVTSIRRLG